jgi:hypothetical protein
LVSKRRADCAPPLIADVRRRMLDKLLGIPRERSLQFRVIERARKKLLEWARASGIRLVHLEYTTPFVETDFSLGSWMFFLTENDRRSYESDGTFQRIEAQHKQLLAELGYPPDWLDIILYRSGSKEVVDRDYEGSYFYFVR